MNKQKENDVTVKPINFQFNSKLKNLKYVYAVNLHANYIGTAVLKKTD